MDSNNSENVRELLSDPSRLVTYLRRRKEEIEETLNDDEEFCDKDIDASIDYIEDIEKKFNEKIIKVKKKLQNIRLKNKDTSEKNKKKFDTSFTELQELIAANKYEQALDKFLQYEKDFNQRTTEIKSIPKLQISEADINKLFSANQQNKSPPKISTVTKTPVPAVQTYRLDDDEESIEKTEKQELRRKKDIENVNVNKDDEDQEIKSKDNGQEVDDTLFGIRSRTQKAPAATNMQNDNAPPVTIAAPIRPFNFSTRLGRNTGSSNLAFSQRNISASSSIRNQTIDFRDPQPSILRIPNTIQHNLVLTPVSDYLHEQNMFFLVACTTNYIVRFKSQLNRLDRWQLGVIERRIHKQYPLDWHDGLIISMGPVASDSIYMFTEREVFIYSVVERRRLHSRILPTGSDDRPEVNSHRYYEPQRGIGTVHDKHVYHIYLNRNYHWKLAKYVRETFSSIGEYDLTDEFPEVTRFLHVCANEKTINLLVQMNDSSYAVVFCSTVDFKRSNKLSPITLSNTEQPLTICSAWISCIRQYVLFVNDPSNDILHILTTEQYLCSYPINCHAICYVADNDELIIVTNKSITSINFTQSSAFFKQFSIKS